MSQRHRRRWISWVLAAAALLVAAYVWLLGPPQPAREPPPSTARQQRPTAAAPATLGSTTAAPQAAPTPTPTGLRAAAASPNLARLTAAEYRQRARYPHWSVPIEPGGDPVLRDREVSRNAFPGPGGQDPSLTVYPAQVSFERPDPVILYAYLTVGDERVPARELSGDLAGEHGQLLARLEFNDAGRDADDAAGDFTYTARLEPGTAVVPSMQGAYAVRVHAVTVDGQDRFASSGFLYSLPDAQLTGRYTDALVDGNLEVQAEIDVATEGRFHMEATLYTPSGQPLAWAQNARRLAPGKQWIPLSFYGLVLREKGADGPYVLRYVALSTTTVMPNAKNRLVENAYVTQPYAAASFPDRPFNDPDLLEAANRLERDAPALDPEAQQ